MSVIDYLMSEQERPDVPANARTVPAYRTTGLMEMNMTKHIPTREKDYGFIGGKGVKCMLFVAVFAAVSVTSSASAQGVCGERTDFISFLEERHHEQPTAMGLSSNGKMIEVLTSEGGTWTIIVTEPAGKSCVVAAGEAWQTMKPRAATKPGA